MANLSAASAGNAFPDLNGLSNYSMSTFLTAGGTAGFRWKVISISVEHQVTNASTVACDNIYEVVTCKRPFAQSIPGISYPNVLGRFAYSFAGGSGLTLALFNDAAAGGFTSRANRYTTRDFPDFLEEYRVKKRYGETLLPGTRKTHRYTIPVNKFFTRADLQPATSSAVQDVMIEGLTHCILAHCTSHASDDGISVNFLPTNLIHVLRYQINYQFAGAGSRRLMADNSLDQYPDVPLVGTSVRTIPVMNPTVAPALTVPYGNQWVQV